MRKLSLLVLSLTLISLTGCKVQSTVNASYEGEGRVTDGDQIECPDQCEGKYTHLVTVDKKVELTAIPAPGYELFGWNTCGMEETCTRILESVCTDPVSINPKGGAVICQGYVGATRNAHAIFVPDGSIANFDVYGENKCLISTSGEFKCWPESFFSSLPDDISNPTEVFLAPTSSCVKDDSVLNCWGTDYVANVPDFDSVDYVAVHTYEACASEDDQVVCWSSGAERIIDGPPLENVTGLELLGSNYSDVCADHDGGTSCWGAIKTLATIPMTLPADIYALADTSTCVYSAAEGLRCWGEIQGADVISPLLDNPVKLGVGWYHICAMDNNGLRCWKNGEQISLPASLSDATDFEQTGDYLCTLDSAGNECWRLSSAEATQRLTSDAIVAGVSQRGACAVVGNIVSCSGDKHFWPGTNVNAYESGVANPIALAANNNGMCIAGSDGVECQFLKPLHPYWAPPESFINISEMVMGPGEVCVIDDGKVDCWGTNSRGFQTVPEFDNPRDLKIGYNHACVIDSGQLRCWGSIQQTDDEI